MAVTISGSDGISGDVPTIKVGNGSESAPAVTGQDTDTGLFFGTNEIKVSTGGTEALAVDSSQNVGIGISTPAANLHVLDTSGGDLISAQGADSDTFRIKSEDNAIGLDTRNTTNGLRFQIQGTTKARLFTSGVVQIDSGYVTLNGNEIGGIQVTIADDAFAEITPPRDGGNWIFVSTAANSTFPRTAASGFAHVDFGGSPSIRNTTVNAEMEVNSGGPPNGTTGNANHVTLFYGGTAGKIYLENRLNQSYTFQVTFF